MAVLVRPRQAVTDVLDVLGEVVAAAVTATADAVAWTRGPLLQRRLQLVPALNQNPSRGPPPTKTNHG
jgi:hypothetical protein